MRSLRFRMCRLLLASMPALALYSCARPEKLVVQSPPVADIVPEAEPQLDTGVLMSAAALDAYDAKHEAWGRREHGKVVRVCQWFRDMGVKVDCTP